MLNQGRVTQCFFTAHFKSWAHPNIYIFKLEHPFLYLSKKYHPFFTFFEYWNHPNTYYFHNFTVFLVLQKLAFLMKYEF